MAIFDVQSPEQRESQRESVERDGEGWRWPVPDRATLRSGAFGSAGGLSDDDLTLLLSEHPAALRDLYDAPSTRARAATRRPPRRDLCNDGGMSLAMLRELLANEDPRAALFSDPDWELHELAAGHWSMFSAPEALAELLHRIATV